MAASCSNSTRFDDALFTGSTENQRQIIGQADSQPMPAAIPQRLDRRRRAPICRRRRPTPIRRPLRQPASYATGGNYGWSAVGGQVITVHAGETLDMLAASTACRRSRFSRANQLRSASDIRPGKVIVIPHRVAIAREAAAQAAEARPIKASYTPAAADPAMRAAPPVTPLPPATRSTRSSRRYGVSVAELVALNGLSSPDAIRLGQTPASCRRAPRRPPTIAAAPEAGRAAADAGRLARS